tara:strand:+ start:394 stop:519 length:126 start_codon:yes stop_codon:yes gene_type:complete
MEAERLKKIEEKVKEIIEYAIYGQEVEMTVEAIMELIKEEI